MSQSKALSRKAQGEETRAILINTAARLFAIHGYNGVSMRTLAAEADVNLATVSYHFGGKAGLYEAIMKNMIDARARFFPTAEETERRMNEAGDDAHAKGDVVTWYITTLVMGMLGNKEHIWPAFLISREMARPTDAFPILEEHFFTPSFESLHTLTTHSLPDDTDAEELTIVAHCIIGMSVKFLECQGMITDRLCWHGYDEHGLQKICAVLSKRIRGFLGLPMENA